MELYVSEFSKYVITLLITLYTYECFAVFRYDNEEARNGVYIRQNILMFASHFCSFLSSALKREILPICFFMRSSRFCCLRLLCCTA